MIRGRRSHSLVYRFACGKHEEGCELYVCQTFGVNYSIQMKIIADKILLKHLVVLIAVAVTSVFFPAGKLSAAVLTHRYSFDTDASDLVGAANGVLSGNAFITNGTVVLDGTNSFVRLPNDLFTNYNSVSFEVWFKDSSINNSNAQVYTFTGTNGGMAYQLYGRGSCVVGATTRAVSLAWPVVGGTNHLVWTQDGAAQAAALYANGLMVGQNTNFTLNTPAGIGSTTNNCIGGCGKITTVSNLNGAILEFRIYQGALTPLEVAVLDAFGPDQPQINPGALQAVRLVVPTPAGPGAAMRPNVFADFASISNVNISAQTDLVLTSDSNLVVTILPDQRLQTLKLGAANITAAWQGFTNTQAMTVSVPQDIALIHRYGFNERTNDWIVHDSVSGAHGRIFGSGTSAAFTGNGELKLVGYPSTGAYAALPGGLISGQSEVTIEAWVNWTPGNATLQYGGGAWQRIFEFGSQAGVQGVSYLFLTPATDNVSFTTKSVLHAAITTNFNYSETPRLNWIDKLPTNVMTFVALTYSPSRKTMKMYLNGIPVASGTATLPLSGIVDTNCWLGRSLFANDAYYNGTFNEFRIYRGLLSDADVAAEFVAGPNTVGVDYLLHYFPATNAMSITWGASVTNVILQTSPSLNGGVNWTPVSDPISLQNGRYSATVLTTNTSAYYRLHTP